MPLQELEQWPQERAERRPVATCMAMQNGYLAAIVAGPVSISPLLAVDTNAFNHASTAEFAATSAVAPDREIFAQRPH
jgi:uncharacterized protein